MSTPEPRVECCGECGPGLCGADAANGEEFNRHSVEIAESRPSVSGQPTPKIVSGEYDDAAAQHDALVRAAEQARAENARLRQERNEARELAAQANAVCSRTLESQHDAWQAKLVAVEAERNAATLLVRTAQAQRDTAARCEEEAINALDRLRERLEQIVKVWTPWPGSASRELLAELRRAIEDRPPDHGDLARSAKRALAATAPQTAPPAPVVVQLNLGSTVVLDGLSYSVTDWAPRIPATVSGETLVRLIPAPTAADPEPVRETGGDEVDEELDEALAGAMGALDWAANHISLARSVAKSLPARTAGDEHLQALRALADALGERGIRSAKMPILPAWRAAIAEIDALRTAWATLASRLASVGLPFLPADPAEVTRRVLSWFESLHEQASTQAQVIMQYSRERDEARREAERLRAEIAKVADDFGVKAVRLAGTTDPLDRVAFALCDDVAERLRALASTGSSDTTGGTDG